MSWTNTPLTSAPDRMSVASASYDPYEPYDPRPAPHQREASWDSVNFHQGAPPRTRREQSADTLVQNNASHPNRQSSYVPLIPDEKEQFIKPYATPRPNPPNPHSERRRSSWEQAIQVGVWPRILYAFCGVAIFAIWAGVVFFFVKREQTHLQFNAEIDLERYREAYAAQLDIAGWPMLQGSLRSFDVDKSTLTVQWAAVTINDDNKTFSPLITTKVGDVMQDNRLGVYVDILAVRDEAHDDPDSGYIAWKLDNVTANRIAVLGMRDSDSVDTDIDMTGNQDKAGDVWVQPSFGYPWDEWEGGIVIVSNWLVDAEFTYNEIGTSAVSFSSVTLTDSIMNWRITAQSEDTWIEGTGCELHVKFSAERPGVVKFVVILVVVVNWIVTISIFLLTGEAIVLQRSQILEGTDILSVCFAALFALPTVRSLLPGAPSQFGALIDFIGILPNIIVISLCTTIFAIAKVGRRIKDNWDSDAKRR